MELVIYLLLELRADVPQAVLTDPVFQYRLKKILVERECVAPEAADRHWTYVNWNACRRDYHESRALPSIQLLYGLGLNSAGESGQLWERIQFAKEANERFQCAVLELPRPLRPGGEFRNDFDRQIQIWSLVREASCYRFGSYDMMEARRYLGKLQELVGDRLRDRNLGPIIPDWYWRGIN